MYINVYYPSMPLAIVVYDHLAHRGLPRALSANIHRGLPRFIFAISQRGLPSFEIDRMPLNCEWYNCIMPLYRGNLRGLFRRN